MISSGLAIHCTITVRHHPYSTGAAYQLSILEHFLTLFFLIPETVTTNSGGQIVLGNHPEDTEISVLFPSLPLGAEAQVNFTGQLQETVGPNQYVTMQGDAIYQSAACAKGDSRGYLASANAFVKVVPPALQFALKNSSESSTQKSQVRTLGCILVHLRNSSAKAKSFPFVSQ